jgi:hypothetical protein
MVWWAQSLSGDENVAGRVCRHTCDSLSICAVRTFAVREGECRTVPEKVSKYGFQGICEQVDITGERSEGGEITLGPRNLVKDIIRVLSLYYAFVG